MFALRATKLYELYSRHNSYEEIPSNQREILQRDLFRRSFEEEWEQTKRFFTQRDPKQIELAEKKPKHKMALVFRSYLGQSSNWANAGEHSRKIDYQIWCGPAIGAFNHWVKGTFLEKWENRKTVTVAMNLMLGAAVSTRVFKTSIYLLRPNKLLSRPPKSPPPPRLERAVDPDRNIPATSSKMLPSPSRSRIAAIPEEPAPP